VIVWNRRQQQIGERLRGVQLVEWVL
jgi:hypothetical protein